MILEFEGEAIEWRGPAPFVFVPVPEELCADIKSISAQVTYGWGVIPAIIRVGDTELKTSLFPKNGGYLVPIKVAIQRAENVAVGDHVAIRVEIPFEPNF
ncbi:MAG: DUF1905 domain-containing protein [Fimbriimonadaceae bacterium]|nr:MAG: DUF1905 domain-containing protein [Fimbriimonadaceae bacterium]